MKNKKWVLVIAVISILAVVFFFDGNSSKKSLKCDKTISSKNDIVIAKYNTDYKNKEYKEKNSSIELSEKKTEEKKDKEINKTIVDKKKINKEVKQATVSPKEVKKELKKTTVLENKPKEEKIKKITKNSKKIKIINSKSKKDKYLTDPTPEGKPKPVEPQSVEIDKNKKLTCTLSVSCKTILDNMDKFNKDKLEVLPNDGIIYKTKTVSFCEGESVFDVLLREMKNNKIHMEFEMTPIYNSNYIEGIHNLYEFDCGELSGWMYKVNGWFPNYGCSRYVLKKGDIIEWVYTCDLGRDVGGDTVVGGGE